MKNLKVSKKLFVTFGIIIILYCVTVAISIAALSSTGGNFQSFFNSEYLVTNQASDLRTGIQTVAKDIGYMMMETDPQKTAEYLQEAQDELQILRDGTAFMQENFTGDKTLIEKYDAAMRGIMEDRDQVFEWAKLNRNQDAIKLYFSSVMPGMQEAQSYLTQINDAAGASATTQFENSMRQKWIATMLMLILSLITLSLTVFFALYLGKSLTKPILEIENAAKEMAAGSLDVHITYDSKDELGSLSNSMRTLIDGLKSIIDDIGQILSELARGNFTVGSQCRATYIGDYIPILNSMRLLRDNLNVTLKQINQSADQVANGSEQVSSGAQALSQGATEQASSVEELAATINEISEQVSSNAQNAAEANTIAEATGNQIMGSNQQMQEMINAMGDISKSSSEIGKIIKTIEDIAFQTNILALNAAVEAARAGNAGKGFAVVADEVRNLASKSAEASKNTASLIESSVHAVENGTKIADETAQSLLSAVEGAKEVVSRIHSISEASSVQANSITQITQGIDQISSVVQTNSATAEQSAAASEELSGQSQILKTLTSKFVLLHDDSRDYEPVSIEQEPSYAAPAAVPTPPPMRHLPSGNSKY